jgi:hypothetical protein
MLRGPTEAFAPRSVRVVPTEVAGWSAPADTFEVVDAIRGSRQRRVLR